MPPAIATDFEQALRDCASEPIHQIGSVQAHGALLVFDPLDAHHVLQASHNVGDYLGTGPADVIGQPLGRLFGTHNTARLDLLLANAHIEGPAAGRMVATLDGRSRPLLAHVYLSQGVAALELEHNDGPHLHGRLDELLVHTLQTMLAAQLTDSSESYFEGVARAVRELLGYDSVMVYQFEADRVTLESIPFSLAELVDGLQNQVGDAAVDKGLALRFDMPAGDSTRSLRDDPLRVGQVLLNLVGNAVKFTAQGSVTVRLRIDTPGTEPVLQAEVQDTGIGMDAAQLARLFRPFEQGDSSATRRFGGTGLGLVISLRLAELMGGGIHVDSRPDVGTTFFVRLPLQAGHALPDAATSAPHASIPSSMATPASAEARFRQRCPGVRVLVAEDEPISREISVELLTDAGCLVDTAFDGAQAVAAAQARDYAVILMDMQMPVMNGLEATRRIRQDLRNRDTHIIATTANAFDDDRAACLAAGMNDHMSKPLDPDRLFDAMLQALASR